MKTRSALALLARLQTVTRHLKERRDEVTVGARSRCGITKWMKIVYYPSYDYHKARGRRRKTRAANRTNGADSTREPREIGGFGRGRLVDDQLRIAVRAHGERLREMQCSDEHRSRRVCSRFPAVDAGSHPYVKRILRVLQKLQLMPVDAQTAVACARSALHTAVDLVCVDLTSGAVIVVEVKCGFDDYADEHNDFMRHELRRHDNSPRNQHQLQLAITAELFRRSYPRLHFGGGYIIRAMARGVYYEQLGAWARSAAPAALRRMGVAATATRV
eukprot:gene26313-32265_t